MTYHNDEILRNSGLPYLVPVGRWHHRLFQRIAPIALFMLLSIGSFFGGFFLLSMFFPVADDVATIGALGVLLISVLVPLPLTISIWKRATGRYKKYATILVIGSFGLINTLFNMSLDEGITQSAVIEMLPFTLGVLLLLVVLEWTGITPIILWAGKTALHEFRTIWTVAGKLLPITLMIVIFAYFSAESWQVTDRLTAKHIALLAGSMSLFALVTSIGVARSEFQDNFNSANFINKVMANVRKFNIYIVVVATQLIQGVIFFGLFSLLLIVIGQIVLTEETLTSWLTHHTVYYPILGTKIMWPVSVNLFRTACFIATFATLSFMMSAANDKQYRELLFDPIFDRIKRILQTFEK